MKRIVSVACLLFFAIALSAPILAQDREAFSIKIDPQAAVNPVKTQHTFIVTVYDQEGRPVPGRRVEWILARGPKCVGDIVEHDDKDSTVGNEEVEKISNHYSVSYTEDAERTLTFGTTDTSDDIKLGVGQTWCTITSPLEGETHVIAFCPQIKNANNHKVFAVKYWIDAKIDWPQNATNRVGDPHTFTFKLTKASSGAPLPGYRVRWKLQPDGPAAYLGESEETKETETQTNEEGEASVVLTQSSLEPGLNTVQLELKDPEGKLLAVKDVVKRWITPTLFIKKVGPAEGILGERVNYTIEVSNPGEGEARAVVVKDTLPEGLKYDSSNPEAEVKGNELSWNLGTMGKGETRRIQLTTRAVKVGDWENRAQIFSDRGPGPTGIAITKIGAPDLYIIKTSNPEAEARLGSQVLYTLTLKNRGNAIARNVLIRDQIPQGLSYQGKEAGFGLKWNVGVLNPGEEKKFQYRLLTVRTGTFTNVASAIMDDKVVHKAECTIKVVAPDLKITKEVDGSRVTFLHKPVNFTITLKNEGSGAALDVNLEDTLPEQLEYVSSEPQGVFRPARSGQLATVRWQLGDIPAGKEVKIQLQARSKGQGTCVNTAKATSEGKVFEATAELRITGVSAMHLSTYDTEDPVEVDKQTIYVIEARNEGTSACTNVSMINLIPEEMEFVSAQGPADFKYDAEKREVVFAPAPILQPGDKLVFRIVCRAVKPGSAKNRGTLRYDQFDKPIMDEEGTSVYK